MSKHTDSSERGKTSSPVVSGVGTIAEDIEFSVTITNPEYDPEQVRDWLLSGEVYAFYGDRHLYDRKYDGAVIGEIEWHDWVAFEPHETHVE